MRNFIPLPSGTSNEVLAGTLPLVRGTTGNGPAGVAPAGIVEGIAGAGMMVAGGGGELKWSATGGISPETAAVISVAETNES